MNNPDVETYNAAFRKASRELHYIGVPQQMALQAVIRRNRRNDARTIKQLRRELKRFARVRIYD